MPEPLDNAHSISVYTDNDKEEISDEKFELTKTHTNDDDVIKEDTPASLKVLINAHCQLTVCGRKCDEVFFT